MSPGGGPRIRAVASHREQLMLTHTHGHDVGGIVPSSIRVGLCIQSPANAGFTRKVRVKPALAGEHIGGRIRTRTMPGCDNMHTSSLHCGYLIVLWIVVLLDDNEAAAGTHAYGRAMYAHVLHPRQGWQ